MRKAIAVIVGSVLFLVVVLTLISGDFVLPYSFAGIVYDEDGNPAENAKVTITKRHTDDLLNCVTTKNGEYQLTASSFPSGYENGDICDYVVIHNNTIKVMVMEIDTLKGGTVIDFYFGVKPIANTETGEEEDVVIVAPSFSSLFFVLALVLAYLSRNQK